MDGMNLEKAEKAETIEKARSILPAHVEEREAADSAFHQKAIHWIGWFHLAISAGLLFSGLMDYLFHEHMELEVKEIVVALVIGLILSKDKLENNVKTRLKVIYGFWFYTFFAFLADGPIVGGIELVLSAMNTYVLLKTPPRIIYYANNALYVIMIAAILGGGIAQAFTPAAE